MSAANTERQLRNLFNLSFDMMGIASEGFMISVNPAWTEHLGWSQDELLADRYLSFIHPDDLDATKAAMRRLIDGETISEFNNRIRHQDGTYRNVQWSLRPQDGNVYMSGRDISQDLALRQRVERSEAIAVAVLHTAADPIIIIGIDGTIHHVNKATTELFGYPYDDLMNQNISMLMPEPYRSEHDGYLHRYLTEGDPRIIGIGREVEAQKADGTIFPMALAVSEAKSDQDHLFTGIIHDLTERNEQRDALQQANTQLEQNVADRTQQLQTALQETRRSNRDLEQFAYVASHDLQAPLRNVRQGLELLDEHLEETVGQSFDEEAQELRGLVVNAVVRMEQLIKGLLAYSRVQREPVDTMESTNLRSLVDEVVHLLQPEFDDVGASIDIGELPTVRIDPMQFRQVFQNLLENAIRYRSPDRDLIITVTEREPDAAISDSGSGEGVVIAVTDNGSGIEPAHHDRIFELFRRGHSGYDGVGLGLAICQRVIESHGGEIWVESAADKGASFVFRLPRLAD